MRIFLTFVVEISVCLAVSLMDSVFLYTLRKKRLIGFTIPKSYWRVIIKPEGIEMVMKYRQVANG
jgi:hypothetical protein